MLITRYEYLKRLFSGFEGSREHGGIKKRRTRKETFPKSTNYNLSRGRGDCGGWPLCTSFLVSLLKGCICGCKLDDAMY